ncbi:MAG: RluA family pseudouridine synthase [Spirochaetales bacterium]
MQRLQVPIDPSVSQVRIDVFLAKYLGIATRSQLKERLVEVRLNGKVVKISHKLKGGEKLELFLKPVEPLKLEPQDIPLTVLYEDERVIVLNKPTGMVVHPGAGVGQGTLVHGLLHHIKHLKTIFNSELIRPGIVHRLDKDTSGVLIAAKDPQTLEFLSSQFREKKVQKIYLALVKGFLPNSEDTVVARIVRDPRNRKKFTCLEQKEKENRGKPMLTYYRVLKQYSESSFVWLQPLTGRTHQLRVQMQALGCPILGDSIYSRGGKDNAFNRLLLHAYRLKIALPNESNYHIFYAPLPQDFKQALRSLSDSL